MPRPGSERLAQGEGAVLERAIFRHRAGWGAGGEGRMGGLTAALESSVVITSDRLCEAKAGVRAGVSVLARLLVGSCWERRHVPGR